MKSADKFLNFRSAHSPLPALCLDEDRVKSKTIFFDDAIYTPISRLANTLTRISPKASVTHFDEQLNNQIFKKFWRALKDTAQKFVRQLITQLLVCKFDGFAGGISAFSCTAPLSSFRSDLEAFWKVTNSGNCSRNLMLMN